jgi:hypothetical protein
VIIMNSTRISRLVMLAIAVSCAPAEQKTQSPVAKPSVAPIPDSSAARIPANPSSVAASAGDTLVRPASVPPAVSAACDSAAGIVRAELSLNANRKEGDFRDSQHGDPRTGCRLSAEGPFKALAENRGPVDILDAAFIRHGWRQDLRHSADGPDGSDVGMRRRDILCLVTGSWNGGDDADTAATAPTPADDSYQIVVECARDIASNADAYVPDSIWSIAAQAGLDSVYAISMSVQAPPYITGDFDGDGVPDAAVIVERRATGKLGVVVVRRGTRKITVLAAGSGSAGPDDLDGMNQWDSFLKGSTPTIVNPYRPNASLIGDALWIARNDSTGGFYIWTGSSFTYEAHRLLPR